MYCMSSNKTRQHSDLEKKNVFSAYKYNFHSLVYIWIYIIFLNFFSFPVQNESNTKYVYVQCINWEFLCPVSQL